MYRTFAQNLTTMQTFFFESCSIVDTFKFVRTLFESCEILTFAKDNSVIDWSLLKTKFKEFIC